MILAVAKRLPFIESYVKPILKIFDCLSWIVNSVLGNIRASLEKQKESVDVPSTPTSPGSHSEQFERLESTTNIQGLEIAEVESDNEEEARVRCKKNCNSHKSTNKESSDVNLER